MKIPWLRLSRVYASAIGLFLPAMAMSWQGVSPILLGFALAAASAVYLGVMVSLGEITESHWKRVTRILAGRRAYADAA